MRDEGGSTFAAIMMGFAVFFLIVGTMLARYGCAATYLIAAVAALSVNAFLLVQLHRKS